MSYEPMMVGEEESLIPKVLPSSWRRTPFVLPAFECVGDGPCRGLRVLMSAGLEDDGKGWLHLSVSRENRCPTWEDMDTVKRIFLGDQRWAYQVHPPRGQHYSLHAYVLHLWSPLDDVPRLPDFLKSRGGTL